MSNTNQTSLEHLQRALSMELTAASQYLLHSHVLNDWGLDLLAAKMREEMNEELGHASTFIERILFLGGKPDMTPEKTPVQADNLAEMFKADLTDEKEAIRFYSEAAKKTLETGDIGTRVVFENAVLDEEGHMAWLDLQLDLLGRLGEAVFATKNMSDAGQNG